MRPGAKLKPPRLSSTLLPSRFCIKKNDLCQALHWGYLIRGDLTVTYRDGETEDSYTGDMFYWPPGHTVKVNHDAEFVLFSPQNEQTIVFDHINSKLGA